MKKTCALLLCLFLLSSCGAAVRSSQGGMVRQTLVAQNARGQKLEGIKVFVNDALVGTTDAKGRIKHEIAAPVKGDSITIRLEKEGYAPAERKVNATADAGFVVGDVAFFLLGGIPLIISLAVDGATDSWMAYPRKLTLTLQEK